MCRTSSASKAEILRKGGVAVAGGGADRRDPISAFQVRVRLRAHRKIAFPVLCRMMSRSVSKTTHVAGLPAYTGTLPLGPPKNSFNAVAWPLRPPTRVSPPQISRHRTALFIYISLPVRYLHLATRRSAGPARYPLIRMIFPSVPHLCVKKPFAREPISQPPIPPITYVPKLGSFVRRAF